MKRKVIQIAESTQLISLPRKWALRHGIKKGDELELEEKGNKVIVLAKGGPEHTIAEVDLTNLDRTSILYYIEILYRIGYDEIKLNFSNAVADHYRLGKKEKVLSIVHYVVSRLMGMEIIQQRENFALLKSLEQISPNAFETVINRIFILLKDAADDFLAGAKKGDFVLLETIEEKHDSIAKFISYGMRILNKVGPGDDRNGYLLFHILNQLDKLTDIIKYSSREIINNKKSLGKDAAAIIESVNKSIKWYADFFSKFEKTKIKDLYLNRDSTLKEIRDRADKWRPDELMILQYYGHILEFLVDITEARIGLEY